MESHFFREFCVFTGRSVICFSESVFGARDGFVSEVDHKELFFHSSNSFLCEVDFYFCFCVFLTFYGFIIANRVGNRIPLLNSFLSFLKVNFQRFYAKTFNNALAYRKFIFDVKRCSILLIMDWFRGKIKERGQ